MPKKITRQKIEQFLRSHATDEPILNIGSSKSAYTDSFPHQVSIDVDEKRRPDIIATVYDLPFVDESYSMVLCTEVLEHLVEPKKAIDEMMRVIRPGGLLLITTRFVFPVHDAPGDYFRYTEYALQHLAKPWTIVSLEPESTTFETIAVLLQRIEFQVAFTRLNRFIKLLLRCIQYFFVFLSRVTKQKEFGDIRRTTEVDHILTSGYYLVIKKDSFHDAIS